MNENMKGMKACMNKYVNEDYSLIASCISVGDIVGNEIIKLIFFRFGEFFADLLSIKYYLATVMCGVL